MSKLHEVLAVENDAKTEKLTIKQRVLAACQETSIFLGEVTTLKMFDEDRQPEEADGYRKTEVIKTVPELCKVLSSRYIQWFDVMVQRDEANQRAKADIVVDTYVLLQDVPVSTLLSMESELEELRKIVLSFPILDDSKEWEPDTDKKQGIFRVKEPVTRNKTEKKMRWKTVVPAKENGNHPAQVAQYTEDVPVGAKTTIYRSGMLPEVQKQEYLERISTLLKAIKQARRRANCVDVKDLHIGEAILGWIFG